MHILTCRAQPAVCYRECHSESVPFIGIWYLLGMLIPTALGAMIGPRLLLW
ncbi:MAG: DUF1109 family protein [Betaproteobacteria bacterium]|nr:DUF1109 family protein [Betaproteobacteria bacterium]